MTYKLILDNEAIWDKQVLDFYKENKDAYGMEAEEIADLEQKIENGEQVKRVMDESYDYYLIVDNDENKVGELLVIWREENGDEELDIAIFEKHQRIAEKIIDDFIKNYAKYLVVTAVIRNVNPNKDYIGNMLTKLGFTYMPSTQDKTYMYFKDKTNDVHQ